MTKKKLKKTEPTLDDLFGAGMMDELKDLPAVAVEVKRHLERAEAYDRLARFFTWAACRATHEAAVAAQKKPVAPDQTKTRKKTK